MTTIKEKLKTEIDDEKFLEMIANLIDDHQSENSYKLSENERQIIQGSRDQIMRGDVFSNDEIKEMSREWIE